MYKVSLYLCLFVISIKLTDQTLEEDIANRINNSNATERTLSRKRRYLVFPTGSSLQLVYCLTVPSVGVGQIFTLGQTAALAWELPDKPEFVYDLINYKKGKTTTEAPETTLPPLHHDHDHGDPHDYGDHQDYVDHPPDSDHPSQRVDKPPKHFSGGWPAQSGKYPGAVNDMKTYYDPFLISKPSVYRYSPISGIPNQGGYGTIQRNSFPGYNSRRRTPIGESRRQSNSHNKNQHYQKINDVKPVTSYVHPAYHQLHRRTRRDLYGKVEKLFTALSRDGKACLMKAICEVSQVAERKGTFMEEIIKVIFRVKPHDAYPDEDEYDRAANNTHNCGQRYPSCEGTIWTSMLSS